MPRIIFLTAWNKHKLIHRLEIPADSGYLYEKKLK